MTDIVLLHGALGAAEQLAPLAERLSGRGRVHVVELEGHGRTPASRDFAMALNLVFGPVAGLALIGAVALYILLFRGGLVKALAFGLVASSGWMAKSFFIV